MRMIKFLAKRTSDINKVINALLLTDIDDYELLEKAVHTWTIRQRELAYEYAIREHLSASDNDDVRRLKCPKWVEKVKKQQKYKSAFNPKPLGNLNIF